MDALHDGNPVGRGRAVYNMRGKKNRFFDERVAHTSICVQTLVRRQRRRVYRKVLLSHVAVLSQRFLWSSNIYMYNKSSPVQLFRENDEIHARRICMYAQCTLLYITRTLDLFFLFSYSACYTIVTATRASPPAAPYTYNNVCMYLCFDPRKVVGLSPLRHLNRP